MVTGASITVVKDVLRLYLGVSHLLAEGRALGARSRLFG